MRAEDHTTMRPLRRARRTLPSTTGPLLAPGLSTTTTHIGAGLGIVCSLASVSLLAEDGLLYHRDVGRDTKYVVVQLYLPDLFTYQIVYCYLHFFLQLSVIGCR